MSNILNIDILYVLYATAQMRHQLLWLDKKTQLSLTLKHTFGEKTH